MNIFEKYFEYLKFLKRVRNRNKIKDDNNNIEEYGRERYPERPKIRSKEMIKFNLL